MSDKTVAVLTNAGGAHLEAYLAGLAATAEAEAVVVADPSGMCEASAKKILGGKLKAFERDFAKVLADHKPGTALITLEAIESPPVIRAALEANCHVLAEKPSCVRIEDFELLAKLADMKHRHLMLAFANRLLTIVQSARKLIQSGQIGSIYGTELHIVADQTRLKNPSYHRSWFADKTRAGGGHLIWLGIHWIDLAMYLIGLKINSVTGFTGIVGGQPLKVEDSAAMALRFENGSFGTMTSGYYLDKGYHSHIKIWGSHGWVQLDPHGGEPLQWYSTKETPPQIKKHDGPNEPGSYTPLVQACVRASQSLAPPPLTTAESLQTLRTIFACYRAAESGQAQMVAE